MKNIEKDYSHIYNEEDDILLVYDREKKPFEFVELSDFISLGLDKDGSFNCIEIHDVSNFLMTVNKDVTSSFLNNLKFAKLKQDIFRGVFLLSLILLSQNGKRIEQPLPLLSKSEYKSPLLRLA